MLISTYYRNDRRVLWPRGNDACTVSKLNWSPSISRACRELPSNLALRPLTVLTSQPRRGSTCLSRLCFRKRISTRHMFHHDDFMTFIQTKTRICCSPYASPGGNENYVITYWHPEIRGKSNESSLVTKLFMPPLPIWFSWGTYSGDPLDLKWTKNCGL